MQTQSHLMEIYRRDNGKCHYCDRHVWVKGVHKIGGSEKSRASKDHVVPRCYGGANHPSNYVLACAGCNNKRQHELHTCNCDFCAPLIHAFKQTNKYFDRFFKEIMTFNKPEVKYRSRVWKVYVCNKQYAFGSWKAAMEFAHTFELNRNHRGRASMPDENGKPRSHKELM